MLDAVIEGQAKINGRNYAANELMMEVLREVIHHVPGINFAVAEAKLAEADGYIGAVPEIKPPGCILPEGYDEGY